MIPHHDQTPLKTGVTLATIEATKLSGYKPVTSLFSSLERPGYRVLELTAFFPNEEPSYVRDLLQETAHELSGHRGTKLLQAADDYELGRHEAFTADVGDSRLQGLSATNWFMRLLTTYFRDIATDSKLSTLDESGSSVPHNGFANLTVSRIELDRYAFRSGDTPPPERFRTGTELGSLVFAYIPLFGSREAEIISSGGSRWRALLPRGRMLIGQAPGLIPDDNNSAPTFNFSKVFPTGSDLMLTIINRVEDTPVGDKDSTVVRA